MQQYAEEMGMRWLTLPFDATEAKELLIMKHNVLSIPTLSVLGGAGHVLSSDGRGEVAQGIAQGPKACANLFESWENELNVAEYRDDT